MWYGEHYHPEKRLAALGFEAGVFALYLAFDIGVHWVHSRRADIEDLARLVINAGFVALAGYVMLDADYHIWMGSLAIGMAAVYGAFGWLLLMRKPEDPRHVVVLTATALAFVALAIPLEAKAAWIPVGWAVEGAALWMFALRIRAPALRYLGAVPLLLAVGRLVFVDTPYFGRQPFVPLFNSYALPACLVAACVLAVTVATRRCVRRPDGRVAMFVSGFVGLALVWQILSVEAYSYFDAQIPLYTGDATHLRRSAQTALSVGWAAYAAVLLGLGFRLGSLPLRWAALAVFGVTLGKVFLIDMAELPGLYRVLAFLILSLMMGGAAWGYQRFQQLRSGAEQGVIDHEAT